MPVRFTDLIDYPLLVFGLVGPIGVDLEYTQTAISDALKGYNYTTELVHITKLMEEMPSTKVIDRSDFFKTYNTKMDYANDLREIYDANDILAAIAISFMRDFQQGVEKENIQSGGQSKHGLAFIVRQLKTPDEIKLLRSVYGRQFIQVSLHGAPQIRENYLTNKAKITSKGTLIEEAARKGAKDLIARDRKEDLDYGQNISSAFPLGDVFINPSDRHSSHTSIERFLKALFGSNEISPTRQEYGMYLAKSASLRSSDLSRQVGAAIFAASGEIVSLGSNEVPRSGGGTYWGGDADDSRDMREGHDPNELLKIELFADIISRLKDDKFLSKDLLQYESNQDIVDILLEGEGNPKYRSSRVMDIIEFGRIIHAEMSAICDAARVGVSIKGGALYCTTFPCHLCAKHIVAGGLNKVVYLEPYPKSYAQQLHSDSILVDAQSSESKVMFEPFIGISPYRYRDLFEKGKRKTKTGEAKRWLYEPRRPMIDIVVPAHIEAEKYVISQLAIAIASKEKSEIQANINSEKTIDPLLDVGGSTGGN